MDEGPGSLPPGAPRRRLGNFRTSELASSVRAVLAEAGIPSSGEPDPGRPERGGRLLDWLVQMPGSWRRRGGAAPEPVREERP
jgi:hypothetical protein